MYGMSGWKGAVRKIDLDAFFQLAPFHLAALALSQPPGLQQAGGGVHQGIARHGRLAKDRPPDLIR